MGATTSADKTLFLVRLRVAVRRGKWCIQQYGRRAPLNKKIAGGADIHDRLTGSGQNTGQHEACKGCNESSSHCFESPKLAVKVIADNNQRPPGTSVHPIRPLSDNLYLPRRSLFRLFALYEAPIAKCSGKTMRPKHAPAANCVACDDAFVIGKHFFAPLNPSFELPELRKRHRSRFVRALQRRSRSGHEAVTNDHDPKLTRNILGIH